MGTAALLLFLSSGQAEQRAIAYLAREVPRWWKNNQCFSCHNNGDAARALYTALRLSYELPAEALSDTTRWLSRPAGWDENRGDPQVSDKKLARIQFAAALVEAFEYGVVKDLKVLRESAESLLPYQDPDGSWKVDAGAAVGSPVTYGVGIATWLARQALEKANDGRFREPVERAAEWFRKVQISSVPDAAAAALALQALSDTRSRAKFRECLNLIRRGQASDGGWGPYIHAPPEPFDTALALLALAGERTLPEFRSAVEKGRSYLLRTQLSEGGWRETTRPPGGQSYAQHISTSGWAALALLETR